MPEVHEDKGVLQRLTETLAEKASAAVETIKGALGHPEPAAAPANEPPVKSADAENVSDAHTYLEKKQLEQDKTQSTLPIQTENAQEADQAPSSLSGLTHYVVDAVKSTVSNITTGLTHHTEEQQEKPLSEEPAKPAESLSETISEKVSAAVDSIKSALSTEQSSDKPAESLSETISEKAAAAVDSIKSALGAGDRVTYIREIKIEPSKFEKTEEQSEIKEETTQSIQSEVKTESAPSESAAQPELKEETTQSLQSEAKTEIAPSESSAQSEPLEEKETSESEEEEERDMHSVLEGLSPEEKLAKAKEILGVPAPRVGGRRVKKHGESHIAHDTQHEKKLQQAKEAHDKKALTDANTSALITPSGTVKVNPNPKPHAHHENTKAIPSTYHAPEPTHAIPHNQNLRELNPVTHF